MPDSVMKRTHQRTKLDREKEPHYKAEFGLKPYPLQQEIIDSPYRFRVACFGRQSGKALDIETPILTPRGWTTIGQLQAGDYVYGDDGKPTQVLWVSEIQTNRDVYAVRFSDDSIIYADAEHEWTVNTKKIRKNNARNKHKQLDKITLKTVDMLGSVILPNGETNYSIPVCEPLKNYVKDLPIEPYLFGVWLGDGTASRGEFTNYEDAEHIVSTLKDYGHELSLQASGGVYSVKGLQTALRLNDLLDNKHIPLCYLLASSWQRNLLLQGLMDTDGYVNEGGTCELTLTNKRLAEDALTLILSLGIKAKLAESEAYLNGKYISQRYRISFTTDKQVFSLPRKAQYITKCRADVHSRYIVSIEPVESRPVCCIAVDNESKLYLAGKTLIPTHNSWTARYMALDHAINKKKEVMWVNPTITSALTHWKAILRLLDVSKFPVKTIRQQYKEVEFFGGGMISIKSAVDPDLLRGNTVGLLIMDEAAFFKDGRYIWYDVLMPSITASRGEVMFCSTPNGKNWFYDIYQLGLGNDPYYKSWHLPSHASPYQDKDLLEYTRQTTTEKRWRQEYLAEFLDDAGGVFIGTEHVMTGDWLDAPDERHDYVAGLDFGGDVDATVICIMDRWTRRVVHIHEVQARGATSKVLEVAKVCERWRVGRIIAETNGLGWTFHKLLTENTNIRVTGYHTNTAKKASMIEVLQLDIERKNIILPRPETDAAKKLQAQLSIYQSFTTETGLRKFEAPKGEHDDYVMALALAYTGVYRKDVKRNSTKQEKLENKQALKKRSPFKRR